MPVLLDNCDRPCPLQFKSPASVLPDPRINYLASSSTSSTSFSFNSSSSEQPKPKFTMSSLIDDIYSKSPCDNTQTQVTSLSDSPPSCFYQRHAAAHNDYVSKVRHTLSSRRARRNAISYNRPLEPERNGLSQCKLSLY